MKCDSCYHKPVCGKYSDFKTDTYAYMGVSFNPDKCENYIDNADVQFIVKAYWIKEYLSNGYRYKCSNCKRIFGAAYIDEFGHNHFCADCGATMIEDE